MSTLDLFVSAICFLVSISCFVVSYRQYKEKGVLLNNAYFYASKEQRINMNKKPHYRQSAITFFIIGIIFLTIVLETITNLNWLLHIQIGEIILLVCYAIISAIKIEKNNKYTKY